MFKIGDKVSIRMTDNVTGVVASNLVGVNDGDFGIMDCYVVRLDHGGWLSNSQGEPAKRCYVSTLVVCESNMTKIE